MLVDGKWQKDWKPVDKTDSKGGFVRPASSFRNWITPDGSAGPTGGDGFRAEAGRYRLYVALSCPWASRVLIVRKLMDLESLIPVTVVNPRLSDQGWQFGGFPGADEDPLFGSQFMHQIYTRADPNYTGRATVPILWDTQRNTIVNNESADLVRMLGTAFTEIAPSELDLYPARLARDIDLLNETVYIGLNNGVYRSGFAGSQEAYDEAVNGVFDTLDMLEARLKDGQTYMFENVLTEADIRTFVSLIRFDAVYHGLFKANRRQIIEYPNLSAYLARMLDIPGVADTVDMDHIMRGYYAMKTLNPTGIVPTGPAYVHKLVKAAQSLG